MITDSFGRLLNNLRLSVTQRCNLNCFYCHREGEESSVGLEMTSDEIERVVRVAVKLGFVNLKLTGGEPLLRADIVEIVCKLSSLPLLREVAMTTNGILLRQFAGPLKHAGLSRVNISLGTLNPTIYEMITGVDAVKQVLSGLQEAVRVGLYPIKVNMVLLKGLNDDQILSMIEFTRKNDLILQLIEFESPGKPDKVYEKYHFCLGEVEEELMKMAVRTNVRAMQNRLKYFLLGGGEVEVVKPMHNTSFCGNCTRLRVTSDGKFKPCLFRRDNLVDFLSPMRNGASDEEIKQLLLEAVKRREPYFK